MNIKIHEAIALTAIAPLLNLNINYEKLRFKYSDCFGNYNSGRRIFANLSKRSFSP